MRPVSFCVFIIVNKRQEKTKSNDVLVALSVLSVAPWRAGPVSCSRVASGRVVSTILQNEQEPIGALWAGLRMGTLCSCASARKITKDKAAVMMMAAASVEEVDAAVQVVVSEVVTLKSTSAKANGY